MQHRKPWFKPLMYLDPPEGEPGGGAPKADPPKADPPAEEKTLTQTEVNAIAAREKAQGKAAAERELAEQLGLPIEEAKAIIAKAKDADEATKSEAQKDRDKAAKEKSDAEADRLAAKNEVHQSRLERAFAREGLELADDDEKSKRLLRLVTAEVGASYEDVLKDVQSIKEDYPALFGGAVEKDPKKRAPSGDPKGNPPKPSSGEDKFAKGAERAKARYAVPDWDPLAKK